MISLLSYIKTLYTKETDDPFFKFRYMNYYISINIK